MEIPFLSGLFLFEKSRVCSKLNILTNSEMRTSLDLCHSHQYRWCFIVILIYLFPHNNVVFYFSYPYWLAVFFVEMCSSFHFWWGYLYLFSILVLYIYNMQIFFHFSMSLLSYICHVIFLKSDLASVAFVVFVNHYRYIFSPDLRDFHLRFSQYIVVSGLNLRSLSVLNSPLFMVWRRDLILFCFLIECGCQVLPALLKRLLFAIFHISSS